MRARLIGVLGAGLRALGRLFPSPPSTNYLYRRIDPRPYDLLPRGAILLDIGSKDARGVYAFGAPPVDAHVICIDIERGAGVDLVADAQDLKMIRSDSVDCVVVISVLPHVRYPHKVIAEAYRVLKPGGVVYVNAPAVFTFIGDPLDNYRFSHRGLAILCEDFDCIDSGFNRGPASTMQQLLVHFMAMLFSFNNRTVYGVNVDLFKWLLFWMKYLDKFLARYQMADVIHSGAYFLGRKPIAEQHAE